MRSRAIVVCVMLLAVCRGVPAEQVGAEGRYLEASRDRPVAPDFSLVDVDGDRHRLSDYRGRVVVVNFWATWCPPCRREMPSMERAWLAMEPHRIVFLAVNVGQSRAQVAEFKHENPVTFSLLIDPAGEVASRWSVNGLPTTFVIDPQGRLRYRAVGDRAWDDPDLLAPILALVLRP